jgi:OOP family OmpA-OmpF porin
MKKRIGSILAACIIITATAAFGANRAGQFSISPVIGGYTFDDKQHLDTNLVYGLRAGYNVTDNFGIEALADYVTTEASRANNRVEMYRYGGEMLYHFIPESTFVPYLAVGLAGLNFSANGTSTNTYTAFDAGLGAKYFLNDKFALRSDVRYIVYSNNSLAKNNFEYTLGAYIPFGGATPAVKPVAVPPPAPAPAPKAAEPPPPPPAAPTATLTLTPVMVTKGQAVTLNWKSQNASGCDIQPGIGPVPPQGDKKITPSASTSYNLSCSGAGGTATSAAGVTVVLPPPPPKPKAAERFCDKPSVVVVEFDTNKSDIKTKYDQDLNKLGSFLKEWSKAKGEISGHTDNVGSDKYNLGLSQRRAASVKKYLVEKFGIAPERLTTEGYGETRPIATNKTKEGRQLNRRIETKFTCD